MRGIILRAVLGVWLSMSCEGQQTQWPEFRGPTADGHAAAGKLPTHIDEAAHVRWKTPIHGKGWSSPVIWGEQIWLTTATPDGKKMSVVCVALKTGQVVHDFVLYEHENPDFCHPTNSYASPTPAIEEGRVYVHFGKYGTACINTETGQVIWSRRDLECDHFRGPASSPLLFENLLIVPFDGADQQYVMAFDKRNGRTVWKAQRNIDYGTENGDLKKAYGTAVIVNVHGEPLLISSSAVATEAFRPLDGERVWILYHGGMNASSRPILAGNGLIIITNGMGQMVAVRPQGKGDITNTNIAWRLSKAVARKSSQLFVDRRLYMVDDKGVISCVNPENGEFVWQERVGGTFAASPIFADGKIYFFSEEGKIYVVAPGDQFKLLAESKLGDGFKASAAISGNEMILRSISDLYCVEEPRASATR